MKALKYLNKFFLKHKFLLISGFVFVTLSNFFALYPAEFVRIALDKVLIKVEQNENIKNLKKLIFNYSLLIVLFSMLKGLFMYFMRQTIIVMSRKIEYDLKNEIFQKYQSLSTSFYNKNKTGDLMNRISEDVSRVRMYLGPAIMYLINIIVLFSLVIIKMLSTSVALSIYVLSPLPILAISVFFVSSKINSRSDKVQIQLSKITNIAQESFSGIFLLKSFVQEKLNLRNFKNNCNIYIEKQLDLIKTEAFFFPLIMVLIGTSTILTVYIGGIEVSKGNITAGTIAEFIIYVNMLTWPIASIGWLTSLIQRAEASQARINEFLENESVIKSNKNYVINQIDSLEFRNVSFKYEKSKNYTLKDISFHLKKGESLGIFGKTGSGKSTILNLIVRLIEPSKGQIYINKKPINEFDLKNLRKSIGYVSQDGYLFSGSIDRNISYSSETINKNILFKSAEIACIDSDIKRFPNKYRTNIGERGVQLSGGQKQRISIARVFYKKSELLIFDDCLSAVDSLTENNIIKNLNNINSSNSRIIVSHRIASLVKCDKIIVIKNGEIVEQGNHSDLINKHGLYHNIYIKQVQKTGDN